MEFAEAVRRRRMVRNFSPGPVAPEAIERILALAQHAPAPASRKGNPLWW